MAAGQWGNLAKDLKASFKNGGFVGGAGVPSLPDEAGLTALKDRELVEATMALPELAFQVHMLRNDPLYDRYGADDRRMIVDRGVECGREYARRTLELGLNWRQTLSHYGIRYQERTRPVSADRVTFAQYVETGEMTVFTDTLDKYRHFAAVRDQPHDMDVDTLRRVLIGHELFHHLEHLDERSVVTRNTKVTTHRLGPLRLTSRASSMSEIAAMAFAKEWTGIDYSPNVYDVLLMQLYEPKAAKLVLDDIREGYEDYLAR